MPLTSFINQTQQNILDILWQQWSQLGVLWAVPSSPDFDCDIIDPEALVLVSCTICKWEPRLFDETIEWLISNSSFINFPRLKSLLKRAQFNCKNELGAVAATVSAHNKRLNWKLPPNQPGSSPLFHTLQGNQPILAFGQCDEIFEQYGFTRGIFVSRNMPQQFSHTRPSTSILRLRSLLGISARAEILLYLMTHNNAHPSKVAADTGYSQKNVQDALVDMTASGIVCATKLAGRKIGYYLTDPSSIRTALLATPSSGSIVWKNWIPLMRALEEMWLGLFTLKLDSPPLLLATQMRELKEQMEAWLVGTEYATCLSPSAQYEGSQSIQQFQHDIGRFLALFTTRM